MERIQVKTSQGEYQVRIGRGVVKELASALREDVPCRRAAIISDSNVAALHLPAVQEQLQAAGFEAPSMIFPAGEASKTLTTAGEILEFLAASRLDRGDVVVALGGGVTGDLAGFAASIYLRGIRVVQIPTTFLAAIDSSVGGKTGVDLPAGKNLAGSFWQPSLVLCDPDLLATLPKEVFHDGTAEAIKYGVIADETLFQMLEDGALEEHLGEVISRCVSIKAAIVSRDEFDRGERALLNFGHTVGHGIEKRSDFAISHGRGVAVGMAVIAEMAVAQGWCQESTYQRLCQTLKRYDLPTAVPYAPEELLPYMLSDKKRDGANITLITPEKIGQCNLRPTPAKELLALMQCCPRTLGVSTATPSPEQ